MSVGDAVFFTLQAGDGPVNLSGRVVEVLAETSEVVVALDRGNAEKFPHYTTKGSEFGFRGPLPLWPKS